MKLPTTTSEARSTQPPLATGELVLKIHGGTWHGRIVRLEALRCTLGSGPQCSLRIRLPGLAPLVCEIDRTAEPAMLRCWAAGVLLNGQPCQQALLNIGDGLSLGGMDFEILGGIAAALPWAGGLPDQPKKKKKIAKPEAKTTAPIHESLTTPVVPKQNRTEKSLDKSTEKRRRRANDVESIAKQQSPLQAVPQQPVKNLKNKAPLPSEFTLAAPLPPQFAAPPQLPKVPRPSKKPKDSAALRTKYLRLREKLRTQQSELEQRTTELTAGQAKLAERQEKLLARRATLESRKSELKISAETLAGETKTLKTQQAELLKQQAKLRSQLSSLHTEQETLHAEQELLVNQREAIQLQQAALQTQEETQRAREEVLRAQEEQLRLQQEQFRTQQTQLRSELDQAQTRQAHLDQVRGELDRHDQQLRQREDQLTQEHERLNTELADLHKEQRELATGRQQLLRGHEKFREAQAEHEEAVKTLQLERQNIESARNEVQRTRAELALDQQRLQSESQQRETELLRAKQELELRCDEHDAACEALAQDQARFATAKQELAALDTAWQLDRTEWDAKCVELSAEQKRISLQLAAAETNLTEREADIVAREMDVAAREADVTARQAELTHELAEVEEERCVLESATARLTCEQMDLEEARTDFRYHAEELETKLAELAVERENFASQRAALERLLHDQRESLATDRIQFVRLRDSYLEERSRWQKTKSRTEHDWVHKYHSLEHRESALQIEGERLRILLATITQQEQQLAASKEDLQQRRLETALAVRNLEEQQNAWTQQQKDWERRESEFIAEQKRLESCRAAFQTEREKWERQQATWQDERQKLGRERADIERERKSVHQERADWDRIRASQLAQASLMAELPSPEEIQQRETSLNQQAAELSAWRDQLRANQEEYDTQRAEWQSQFGAAQSDLDRINGERAEFQRQLSMQQSERERLEQLQGELDELRRHLHSQRQDTESRAQDVIARESNLLPREHEIRQAGEQLAQREAQLAMERAGYEIQRVKQQELTKSLATQRADLDRRMMPQGEQLEAYERLQHELEQERQAASQLRQELESLQQNPEVAVHSSIRDPRVAELEAELTKAREELLMQLAANEQERETLASERAQLDQARIELQNAPVTQTTLEAKASEQVTVLNHDDSGELEAVQQDIATAVVLSLDDTTNLELVAEAKAIDSELTREINADETNDGEENAAEEQPSQGEDQIFARLRALTGGKSAPDQRTSLRASFFKDEAPTEETAEEETDAEPVKQHMVVKSYLPTNIDEDDEAENETGPVPVAARPAPAPEASEGEDESIDDYMQRLLDRMRGSSEGEGKISNQNQNGKDQHSKEQRKRAEQSLRDAADAVPAKPKREYVRTEAPEKKADLAAMRELANSTARSAVQTSRSKVAASQALSKLILGGGGMAIAAGALMFLGEEEFLFQMLASVGMILSLLWLAYGLYLSRDMLFAKAKRELVLAPAATNDAVEVETAVIAATAETGKIEAS